MSSPFLSYVKRNLAAPLDVSSFPGNLPFVSELDLEFEDAVTFLVGENGSGKSTLLEAIAVLAGFPMSGGSFNEVDSSHGLQESNLLANALRLAFKR